MTRRFQESIIEHGPNPTRVEEGRVINVNMKRWTLDVRTRESQRTYYDIKWSSPYLHFAEGEGINFMPEVGAKVMVCRPATSDPFVLCFVTPFERLARQPDESGETPEAESYATDGTSQNADVSYRAGRPYLQQGDIHISTRDGNAIWLRRGGIVEIGSTAVAKRLYIPLLNYLRDVCENYDLQTAGGHMSWTVTRSDVDPEDEATAVLTYLSRNTAQDSNGTVVLQIGHVDDTKRLRLSIAPNSIDPQTLEVSGSAVYTLDIDEEGTVTETTEKDYDLTVSGEVSWEVSGSATFQYSSDVSETVSGDKSITISGDHSLSAGSSTESMSNKTIDSSDINLGGSASKKVVIATNSLIGFISGHTHDVYGSVTGTPKNILMPAQYTANKVKAE
jgi:hypothetical protein